MKLLLINPNTSDGFTAIAQKAANTYKRPDTIVDAVSSPLGPLTLEGYFDEILSSVGVMETIQREKENYDGFIVACFSNHFSIYGSRQLTDVKRALGISGEAQEEFLHQLGIEHTHLLGGDLQAVPQIAAAGQVHRC